MCSDLLEMTHACVHGLAVTISFCEPLAELNYII